MGATDELDFKDLVLILFDGKSPFTEGGGRLNDKVQIIMWEEELTLL